MKIYLDVIFILNFCFDFILLLSVSIILRRNISIKRLLLGSFIGGLSVFILFININSIELFLLKLLISIVMILLTFKYKNITYSIKNLGYLYMSSLILGGFLYFLNVEFSYKQEGLVFYHNGLSINFIVLIILSPLIIYIYIRQAKNLKNNYSLYHKVNIYYKNKIYKLNGYLDTGNNLKDPVTKKPILIIRENIIKKIDKYMLVPCTTINNNNLIKCFKVDKIEIDNYIKKNVLVGIVENLNMEGIDCILNNNLMGKNDKKMDK